MLWINFLHLYQPANSSAERIKEAADKSYYRLTRLLEEHPTLHFTFNISGCLLERLRDDGFNDLLERWRQLIGDGRLEITGSAAYHGFLPLLPVDEVEYQIRRQEEITKEILGVDLRGHGFFLPELAYTPALAKLIKGRGYEWLVLDEASLPADIQLAAGGYIDTNSGLKVIVRRRDFSNAYIPELIQKLAVQPSVPAAIITATDAELYGLRHEDPTAEMEKMAALPELQTLTVSGYLQNQERLAEVAFRSASWETNWAEDGDQPFSIWQDRHNRLQTDLWCLVDLVFETGRRYQNDPNLAAYRWHLDRGLASCMFWWASGRDFSHNFGPVAWNPDEVENILNDLVRSVRSLQSPASRKEKLAVEKLAARIKRNLWRCHWKKHFN